MASVKGRRKNSHDQFVEETDVRLLLTAVKAVIEIPCGRVTTKVELRRADWDRLVRQADMTLTEEERNEVPDRS